MRFSRGNAGNAETADDFCKIITGSLAFLLGRKGLEMEKHAYGSWKTQLMLAGLGIVIGALVGCLDTIFGKVLLWVSDIRTAHIFYLVPALPLVGVCIVWAYKKYGGRSGEGMGLILSVSHREDKEVPRRLIPFVMISTWLTHLFGGSAGREGVAVQLGATVSHQVGKRFSIEDGTHIFLLTGMAAGFAGLFRTPLAAIFFAMEVPVVGQLALRAILPMCTAAFTAASVSAYDSDTCFCRETHCNRVDFWLRRQPVCIPFGKKQKEIGGNPAKSIAARVFGWYHIEYSAVIFPSGKIYRSWNQPDFCIFLWGRYLRIRLDIENPADGIHPFFGIPRWGSDTIVFHWRIFGGDFGWLYGIACDAGCRFGICCCFRKCD